MNSRFPERPRPAAPGRHVRRPAHPFPRGIAAGLAVAAIALAALASPCAAQWSRVSALPASRVFAVKSAGDTLVAAADSAVYVSTDAGATWRATRRSVSGPELVPTVLLHGGRIYAGTDGKGVYASDDLGVTWQAINAGLVGGFLDSQLDISSLAVRGDSLYAGTFGAGVYVRPLAAGSTWSHFGEVFEPNQASNVIALARGGTRLVAGAGGNGSVFHRDPGEPEWVISWLDNVGLHPGVQAQTVTWTGTRWVVSTVAGLFCSATGEEPWTRVDLGIGVLSYGTCATRGARLFGAFDIAAGARIAQSDDDGDTWAPIDDQPGVFVFALAAIGDDLFAGRTDGLWRRSTATSSVPQAATPGARLRLAGRQPAGDDLRFVVDLPEAASATLELFDITGRRVAGPLRSAWPAGTHAVSLDARGLPPGVYEAMLGAGRLRARARVVRVR